MRPSSSFACQYLTYNFFYVCSPHTLLIIWGRVSLPLVPSPRGIRCFDFCISATELDIWSISFLKLISILTVNYEGRSINRPKLQNGAIPLILKIGKIRNICFVGNLILKIHINFLDDDVIIVMSSVHRTQSICVLFSPPVFYHNSKVINSIGTRKNE